MSSPPRPLVLLVEDCDDDGFFFRWTLQKGGLECDIERVIDGCSAVERLNASLDGVKRIPDLIFIDLKIPTFNGFEVLTWLREHTLHPSPDVTVLSGSEHTDDIKRCHALGAAAYYVKPLSVEQLRARFASWRTRQRPEAAASDGVDRPYGEVTAVG
jgi:DNA-binding response OmpR family regulator